MLSKASIFISDTHNPYQNLSMEKCLLEQVKSDEIFLFLWQNQNTIVVGRNQNVWKEINVSLFEENDGHIVRRLSGGGAVYHDLGNLNFTFISKSENMNIAGNMSIIQEACTSFGLDVVISGRNDLTIGERKFSGNAFYNSKGHSYHHGTIMIDVNPDSISRYLTVDPDKLRAKAVDSVRKRVINLKELNASITIANFRSALIECFKKCYSVDTITHLSANDYQDFYGLFSDRSYILGKQVDFSTCIKRRFDWGIFDLNMNIKNGIIDDLEIFSDAMDSELINSIKEHLHGCRYELGAIKSRLSASQISGIVPDNTSNSKEILTDILNLLKEAI